MARVGRSFCGTGPAFLAACVLAILVLGAPQLLAKGAGPAQHLHVHVHVAPCRSERPSRRGVQAQDEPPTPPPPSLTLSSGQLQLMLHPVCAESEQAAAGEAAQALPLVGSSWIAVGMWFPFRYFRQRSHSADAAAWCCQQCTRSRCAPFVSPLLLQATVSAGRPSRQSQPAWHKVRPCCSHRCVCVLALLCGMFFGRCGAQNACLSVSSGCRCAPTAPLRRQHLPAECCLRRRQPGPGRPSRTCDPAQQQPCG